MADANLSALIWSGADLLRGDYKPHEYGRVVLSFTVLRCLDYVLELTKSVVLAEHVAARHGAAHGGPGPHPREPVRLRAGVLARSARHLRALRLRRCAELSKREQLRKQARLLDALLNRAGLY